MAPPQRFDQRPSIVWGEAGDAALDQSQAFAAKAAHFANSDAPVLALASTETAEAFKAFAWFCRKRAMNLTALEKVAAEEPTGAYELLRWEPVIPPPPPRPWWRRLLG